MRVRSLLPHSDYRCGHTGACCSAGWEIPIEAKQHTALRSLIERGKLRAPRQPRAAPDQLLEARGDLPPGLMAIFAREPDGRCVFLEEGERPLCAIHRQCSAEALPMACHQFPRVALLRPSGIDVTLSHWCPTALSGLLRRDLAMEGLAGPPAFPAENRWEGLDARHAHPPMLRPGCLMGWEEHDAWETLMVEALAAGSDPFAALGALIEAGDRLRRWAPGRGLSLRQWIEAERQPEPRHVWSPSGETLVRLHDLARGALPGPLQAQHSSSPIRWPVEAWREHRWIASRHLAARAFANWTAVQGEGIRTTLLHLACTLAVLAVKASRHGDALDEAATREAVRGTDLMLLHHADPGHLTHALGFIEVQRDWSGVLG